MRRAFFLLNQPFFDQMVAHFKEVGTDLFGNMTEYRGALEVVINRTPFLPVVRFSVRVSRRQTGRLFLAEQTRVSIG